jgi:hypothetical protein
MKEFSIDEKFSISERVCCTCAVCRNIVFQTGPAYLAC